MIDYQEKACLREIAREIARQVIQDHAAACPWRLTLQVGLLRLALLMAASGAVGGSVVAWLRGM